MSNSALQKILDTVQVIGRDVGRLSRRKSGVCVIDFGVSPCNSTQIEIDTGFAGAHSTVSASICALATESLNGSSGKSIKEHISISTQLQLICSPVDLLGHCTIYARSTIDLSGRYSVQWQRSE